MPEKILVVDDDVDTLRLVGLMLQRQGYQIVAANNGHQALVMAQNEKPDLILLDVMMPDLDGYEVTRRLRSSSTTKQTPIIMFTAKAQVDEKVAGFEAGVDDYLTKPTQPRELFAHVKAVLARGKKVNLPVSTPVPSKDRGYVVGVLSPKGGLGTSTVALNLGIALRSKTNKDVIVAEYRPGEGSMALDVGIVNPEGLNRLLAREPQEITPEHISAELIVPKSEIRLLPASYRPSDGKYTLKIDQFEALTRQLAHMSPMIVIDLGSGLPPKTEKMLHLCDELIILLEAVPHTVTRTQIMVEELMAGGYGEGRITPILYNRQRIDMPYPLAQVQQDFKHSIASVFTAAPELTFQSSKNGNPLVTQHPDNITSQQFFKLAESIIKHMRARE